MPTEGQTDRLYTDRRMVWADSTARFVLSLLLVVSTSRRAASWVAHGDVNIDRTQPQSRSIPPSVLAPHQLRPRWLSLRRAAAERLTHPVPPRAEVESLLLSSGQAEGTPGGVSVVSVTSFGAVGDGVTDNTKQFQAALDSLGSAGGGVCFVPAGNYSFDGSIALQAGVSLVGTSQSVADAPGTPGGSKHPPPNVPAGEGIPVSGSILLVRGGRGNESATPFITLNENSALRGVSVFYPENPYDDVPVPYPWAVDMVGDNAAVIDCLLLNPWLGIRAVNANRHYIARVQGQPVKVGVFIDATFDIGRLEDIHWMHLYSVHDNYLSTLGTIGTGFIIARSDWEYVFNTFVFEMAVGYHFTASTSGSCNGNFVGIGADATQNASVLVDSADASGILIVNGEFTSFTHPGIDSVGANTQVVVTGSNTGAVRFDNCAFWGPGVAIATINGTKTSSVAFDNCIFNTFDAQKNETRFPAAITLEGPGSLLVRGCEFQTAHAGGQVLLANGSGKVIVKDNLITGVLNVTDLGARVTIIKDNAADAPTTMDLVTA